MTIRSRTRRTATTVTIAFALLLAACGGAEVSIDPAADPADPDDAAVDEPDAPEAPEDDAQEDPEGPGDDATDGPDDTIDDPIDGATDPEPAGDHTAAPDADCSAQGATIAVRPVDGMPAEVAAARDFLLDAALRCDEQLLFTATEESSMFTFSFGDDTDPIGYWWDLEAAGEQPFLRLAQVLGTTPALSAGGDVWVFPRVTTGRDADTTDEAWAELTWLEDPAAARATGDGYLDWRAGISPDGEWRFFVVGD
jgi:hypothetical protein